MDEQFSMVIYPMMGMFWIYPPHPKSNRGKYSLFIGIPEPKTVIILVVAVAGKGIL